MPTSGLARWPEAAHLDAMVDGDATQATGPTQDTARVAQRLGGIRRQADPAAHAHQVAASQAAAQKRAERAMPEEERRRRRRVHAAEVRAMKKQKKEQERAAHEELMRECQVAQQRIQKERCWLAREQTGRRQLSTAPSRARSASPAAQHATCSAQESSGAHESSGAFGFASSRAANDLGAHSAHASSAQLGVDGAHASSAQSGADGVQSGAGGAHTSGAQSGVHTVHTSGAQSGVHTSSAQSDAQLGPHGFSVWNEEYGEWRSEPPLSQPRDMQPDSERTQEEREWAHAAATRYTADKERIMAAARRLRV